MIKYKPSVFGVGRTNVSCVLMIIGVISLYWSVPMFFIAGSFLRLGSLVFGFCSIALASLIRSRFDLSRYVRVFCITGLYFLFLGLQSKIQEHNIWDDPLQIIFCLICLFLFWFGFILGRSKETRVSVGNEWILVVFGVCGILALLGFLRFVKEISFYGTQRQYGDTSLNPVGVAYSMTCLVLAYLVLSVCAPKLWRKMLFFAVVALAFIAVLSSASRGALFASLGAVIYFVLLNRRTVQWSIGLWLNTIGGIFFMLLIIWIIYHENYAVSERLELLIKRVNGMFKALSGNMNDPSMSIREITWNYYIKNIETWIVFGEKEYSTYPHNQFFEILVRFGLFGIPLLLMSLFIIMRVLSYLFQSRQKYDLEFSFVSILFVFSYLQSMTSLSLQMNRVMWLGFGYFMGIFFNRNCVNHREFSPFT